MTSFPVPTFSHHGVFSGEASPGRVDLWLIHVDAISTPSFEPLQDQAVERCSSYHNGALTISESFPRKERKKIERKILY